MDLQDPKESTGRFDGSTDDVEGISANIYISDSDDLEGIYAYI